MGSAFPKLAESSPPSPSSLTNSQVNAPSQSTYPPNNKHTHSTKTITRPSRRGPMRHSWCREHTRQHPTQHPQEHPKQLQHYRQTIHNQSTHNQHTTNQWFAVPAVARQTIKNNRTQSNNTHPVGISPDIAHRTINKNNQQTIDALTTNGKQPPRPHTKQTKQQSYNNRKTLKPQPNNGYEQITAAV